MDAQQNKELEIIKSIGLLLQINQDMKLFLEGMKMKEPKLLYFLKAFFTFLHKQQPMIQKQGMNCINQSLKNRYNLSDTDLIKLDDIHLDQGSESKEDNFAQFYHNAFMKGPFTTQESAPVAAIMQKYSDTLRLICENTINGVESIIVQQIVDKLKQFYRVKAGQINLTADFDIQFELTLDAQEKELYDDIVIEAADKKQTSSIGFDRAIEKQLQQFQSQSQVSGAQSSKSANLPNLYDKFDETLLNLINVRGRPDLLKEWLKTRNRVEFNKTLLQDRQNNFEFIDRLKVIESFNHFYSDILLNYLEIPLNLKNNNNEKLRKRQEEATRSTKKVIELITDQQQIVVQEQMEFFNSLANVKYFYKFYKLRTLGGKERDAQISMKKILLKYILDLYELYQQDDLKRSQSTDVKDILKQLYQQLKIKTHEIEYAQLFNLIKDVKKCLIHYYRFRTFFLNLIQNISIEFQHQTEIADLLITQCMKSLHLIQNSKEKKDLGELAEICWTMIKNCDLESLVGTSFNQVREKLKLIELKLKKQNQVTKVISVVLQSLLNRTTNKGLEIYQEYLKSCKNWQKPYEIFSDIYEWEVRWLIQVKDIFGDLKEFYQNILKIRPKESKSMQVDQNMIEERKQEIFYWVDFIRTKKSMMSESLSNINDENIRLESVKTFEMLIFDDPSEIRKKLAQLLTVCTQKDGEIIDSVMKSLDQEKRIQDIMRDFIQKFQVNLEKSDKKQYQMGGEILKYHLMLVLESQDVLFKQPMPAGLAVNNYFYYPSGFHFYLYFSKDKQSFIINVIEYLEKFRFVTLGLCLCEKEPGLFKSEINTLKDNMSHLERQTSVENYIQSLSLDFQFVMAQRLYNYAVLHHNCSNDHNKLQLWNDAYPAIKVDTSLPPNPSLANNMKLNLNCFIAQYIINQKVEQKLFKNVEQIHKLIKFLKDTNFQQDDFKNIPEFTKNNFEHIQKLYIDVRQYKIQLEKDLLNLQQTQPSAYRYFQKELYDIFSKSFSKSSIIRQVEKVKLELKIPLNKDEILNHTQSFWEQKFLQHNQMLQQQTTPQQQTQGSDIKNKFLTLMNSFRKIDKDGYEFYKEMKQQLEGQNQDRFIKEQVPDFYKQLDKYFPQATSIVSPQILQPITPVIQPKAQRPSSLINQQHLNQKLQIVRKKYGFGQPNEEEQKQLLEFIQDKFFQYMKQFLGKVFQAAVAQNAGDEIKVYQTQTGGGLQQMLEGDKNSEIRIKQLTDLFQNYGPKKDGDYDTTLLTGADQPLKQVQYSLCDLTPISRQPDFGKYLIEVDRQQEALLKNRILMKKWRDDKPELRDILSKKIKRGTDLGDAVQSFLIQRVQSEQEKNEGEIEQEPEDESEKIKTALFKSLKSAQDTSATTTRTQMQNRLRNMESNNHLIKRKEISVKTVQSVLESMSLYRKSKILQKSYLF